MVRKKRNKNAGEKGRWQGKEQGRRGRREKEEKPADERATCIPGARVITYHTLAPRKGSSQGGGGWEGGLWYPTQPTP